MRLFAWKGGGAGIGVFAAPLPRSVRCAVVVVQNVRLKGGDPSKVKSYDRKICYTR